MQKQEQTCPALRFPNFSENWIETTIGDNFEFKNGLNKGKEFFGYGSPIINFKDVFKQGGITSAQLKGLVDVTESEKKNCSAKKGDVFFNRTSEVIEEIGRASVLLETIKDCVFSGFVLRARPTNDSLIDEYKKYCFSVEPVRKEITSKSSCTTRALTSGSLLSSVVYKYPQKKEEQQKIAAFLGAVDEKIAQLQKNKYMLEEYKKGCMQKLFSQEIRFKDDNGNAFPDWEETVLGEHCHITTGSLDANAMTEDGKYPFFTCAREAYKIDTAAFNTEALLISGNGANVGYVHYYKGKFNAYQRTYVLDGFEHNIQFIEQYLRKNLRRRIFSEVKEGNTPYIVKSTLTEMPINFPHTDEQKKIADFLSALDDKITLVTEELDKAKTFKKGLLQQMFV